MPNREGILDLENISRYLAGGEIGAQMEIHDEIPSTNTRAKALAQQGAAHGTAVLARRQSAGRGRFGRKFYSPDDCGVYISFILRPSLPADRAVRSRMILQQQGEKEQKWKRKIC